MNASVTIDDSLPLDITRNGTAVSNITLSLDPASNPFAYQDLDIAVGTNNETGYQLTVTTPNDATNLVNTEDSSATIPTISTSGNYTASNFPVNQWGYKNGTSNNYIPFASNTIILQKDTRVNNDTTTLRFASRIDYTKKSGLYSTTLAFTVVANPVINYMQDMDPALCTTTPTTVVDKRDNKEYTIAKLADGQCWMTSDLNLAGGTKLYSETSNVPAGYPESGGTGYYTLPASSTAGFDDDTEDFVYNTGNETTNQADCNSSPGCNSYYSWLAATAGGKDASGTAVNGDGYNAAYSICPKGWRLPTATTSNAPAQTSPNWKTGDFYKVATAYGANLESQYYDNSSATFYNNAGPGTTPNFLLASYYYSSTFYDGGTYGYYWSSSSLSSTLAYLLSFSSSGVGSAGHSNRRRGFSVRCVLTDTRTISDITYMQDVNNDILANTANGTTKTLKDARDNKEYTVAKLADGKVWMTSDLNLAGGTKLYSETSDVPSGFPESGGTGYFTLPASSTTGFNNDNTAYVYNSGNETTNQADCSGFPGCNSYYSWLAATAGGKDAGGTAVNGDGYNAAYSICPKGWRLPTATTSNASATSNNNWKTGDFYKVATAYGANLESSYYENATTFYNNAGPGTLPDFLRAGYYNSSTFYDGGTYGYYWSSSSNSYTYAYNLYFSNSRVYLAVNNFRRFGSSVRCVFAGV